MSVPSLHPPDWHIPKKVVPGEGQRVCALTFNIESLPEKVELQAKAWPYHAVFLNGEFVGSDIYAFVTVYDVTSKLRTGINEIKVLVVPLEGNGWFSVDAVGLSADISTANPNWQWLNEDHLLDSTIVPFFRGSLDAPWDGGGQWFDEVPVTQHTPAGVVNVSKADPNTMFPSTNVIISYSEGEKVPFEGEVVFDFGKETIGYIELEIESKTDCQLTLRYAESFNRLDVHLWFHADDHFRLKPGRNPIFCPNRKGFRYLRLSSDKAGRLVVKRIINHRPMRRFNNKGYFKCSDKFLNRVNEVSCYTAELCSQKFLEDGIKRDQLCWTGDLRPMAKIIYNQLGNTKIVRDSLYAFARHTNVYGVMQPAYPWRTGWVMTDYIMWWIISLWEYYEQTQDIETLRELAPIAFDQAKWLKTRLDERGLIRTEPVWDAPITCWSSRDRNGYTSYHNSLWYLTQGCLMNIGQTINPERDVALDRSSDLLQKIFVDRNGLWRDLDFEGNFRPEVPHDGTVTAFICGIDKSAYTEDPLTNALKNGWTKYGAPVWWPSGERKPDETSNRIMPLYNAYEAEMRIVTGDWSGGYEILKRCFGHMLNVGATSFWECIQMDGNPDPLLDMKAGFASLCHGWSGYPAAFLPGILGWSGLRNNHALLLPYAPHAYGGMAFAEASIPVNSDQVFLRSEWDEISRIWRYRGRLPEDNNGSITTGFSPEGVESIESRNCDIDNGESMFVSLSGIKGGEEFEVAVKCTKSYISGS